MNSIAYGASRAFNYPPDKFSELPRSLDEWKSKIPSVANAWASIRELATQGHPIAATLVKIDAAMSAKKIAAAEGSEVPAWARETLSFLDEYQTENLDDVLAALSRAID